MMSQDMTTRGGSKGKTKGRASGGEVPPKRKRTMRKPVPREQLPKGRWTIDEAAAFFGRCKDWVGRRCSAEQMPHYKNGNRLEFDGEELERWRNAQGRRGPAV